MEGEKLTVSPMTLEALEKALECDTPMPLKTTAARAGLLPGGRDTPVKKRAREECLNKQIGLFDISGTEAAPQVIPTRTGIETLFAHTEAAKRRVLLEKAADTFKEVSGEVVMKLAAAELKELTQRQGDLARRAGELRSQLGAMLKEQLASVENILGEVTRQAEELRVQSKKFDSPEAIVKSGTIEEEGQRTARDRPRPETDGDIDFQRDLCRELALTWEDTPEARGALERVMINAGLEQIGEAGEIVPFDAGQHRPIAGNEVLAGQHVRIVEPGWVFQSPRGVLPIVRPKVASEPQ